MNVNLPDLSVLAQLVAVLDSHPFGSVSLLVLVWLLVRGVSSVPKLWRWK